MVNYDALNNAPRVKQQTYVDGTDIYSCFAVAGTDLTVSAEELSVGRGWAILLTQNAGTDSEILTWARNTGEQHAFFGSSHCQATDLATVQGYTYG